MNDRVLNEGEVLVIYGALRVLSEQEGWVIFDRRGDLDWTDVLLRLEKWREGEPDISLAFEEARGSLTVHPDFRAWRVNPCAEVGRLLDAMRLLDPRED